MKKLILSLLLVSAFAFMGFSQDDGSFKPTSGFTAEVNFLPANTNIPISMDYLKLRMFMSENMALRIGFNFGMHNEKYEKIDEVTITNPNEEYKFSYMKFGIVPGIEMHMGDMPKLSPYVGAELGFFMKSAKEKITNFNHVNNSTYEVEGGWNDAGSISNPAYTQIGLNLILGTDYYFSKHIFMGAEIGFGFSSTSYKEVKETSSAGGLSVTVTTPKSTGLDAGFNYNSAIRLGWAF